MRDLKLAFITAAAACAILAAASGAIAQTVPVGFADQGFASGITNGTAMAFAPDGRLFVCEQGPGTSSGPAGVRVFSPAGASLGTFHTFTVDSVQERGLLGIAFDPNFGANRFVYVYHTVPGTPPNNRVTRLVQSVATPNQSDGSVFTVVNLDPLSGMTNHNGGAVHFGLDGKLYVAVGDNANSANAQSLLTRHGKVLRLNADGTLPGDNPTSFPGITGPPTGANRAIWAVGLRNPFTLSVQPGTGRTFINDVGSSGPNVREEINDGVAGSNYGWDVSEGYTTNPDHRSPLHAYDHSAGQCAITGGTFYNPSAVQFPASYAGMYFFADYCAGWIRILNPADNSVTGFATGLSFPVDIDAGPDGALYYLNRGTGEVRRVRYTGVPTQNLIVTTNS